MKFNEARKIVKDMQIAEKTIADMVDTMGIYAINHYKKSFIDTGFTDENWEPWKRRKNKDSKRGRQFRYERHQGTDEEEGKKFLCLDENKWTPRQEITLKNWNALVLFKDTGFEI